MSYVSELNKPLLAITMGDPAGVGPEIIVGSWRNDRALATGRRFVIGRKIVLQRAVELLGCDMEVVSIRDLNDVDDRSDRIPVWEIDVDCDHCAVRSVSAIAGQAAIESVSVAAKFAMNKQIDGIVTAPLNKAAIHLAGFKVPGHTEFLAEQCGVEKVAMMLYLPPAAVATKRIQKYQAENIGLGVVHVTLHTALRNVFAEMTNNKIQETCRLANRFAEAMLAADGFARAPRVGVAALNPHGGEGGLFGDEEIETIGPAVAAVHAAGFSATGPLPCDTLMHRAAAGEFDVVVAMYHDQGHIALKLLELQQAVNITLGLPIIRTSVAHGTAFDIAWKGIAQSGSMVEAIVAAAKLAKNLQWINW